MYFESLDAFLAMGRHGLYVWLSYGICFAAFVFLVVYPIIKKRKMLKLIRLRAELAANNPEDPSQ